MKLRTTDLPGLMICEPRVFTDGRGKFVKTYHEPTFREHGCEFEQKEAMYSLSKRGVLRGMHFQTPPAEHAKLVYCLAGSIMDVVVDIRRGSPTYGKFHAERLSGENHRGLLIPAGFAHGFLALEDNSLVAYSSTCAYVAENDVGIRWDSFGYDWPVVGEARELSARDEEHPRLEDFASPFEFGG